MQARSLLFPGETPGHSLLRSATQCPTANLSCAVAFDDQTIKKAPIIKMIFTIEGPPHRHSLISGDEEFIGFDDGFSPTPTFCISP